MWHPPQGVHNFLRAYYHMKSADWTANKPFPLASNAASEQAKLPRYYVMDLDKGMAEQVAGEMPSAAQIASCKWLTDEELKVYSSEYGRNSFQGDSSPTASAACRGCPLRFNSSRAARSTCRRCSCPARATGASINAPEVSKACSARARSSKASSS